MMQSGEEDDFDYDVATAKAKYDNDEVHILDVREPDEWDQAHISGATWIPLGQLERRYTELDPNTQWVAVCHAGGRSAAATEFLRDAGYNVTNLAGGMMAWASRRYPMESGRETEQK